MLSAEPPEHPAEPPGHPNCAGCHGGRPPSRRQRAAFIVDVVGKIAAACGAELVQQLIHHWHWM